MKTSTSVKARLGKRRLIVGFLFATGLGAACLSRVVADRIAEHAAVVLTDIQSLPMGKATLQDVQQLAARNGGFAWPDSKPCTEQQCQFAFTIDNHSLSRLHLAKPTIFSASLGIQNGRLATRSVGLTTGGEESSASVFVSETMVQPFPDWPAFHVARHRGWQDRPWRTVVHLTPMASPEQRYSAYSVNVSCLSRLLGCRDARELAPALWPEGVKGN
jgi:hypothetical protein